MIYLVEASNSSGKSHALILPRGTGNVDTEVPLARRRDSRGRSVRRGILDRLYNTPWPRDDHGQTEVPKRMQMTVDASHDRALRDPY
jgi:hypothetical protein